MPPEVHLSSLVIHAIPARLDEVARGAEALGCEIHLRNEAGKLVVTLETLGGRTLSDRVTRLQKLEGVLSATLVFHHSEPQEGGAETPPARRPATEAEP